MKLLRCSSGESLAYNKVCASSKDVRVGIVFLAGFMSNMNGEKALAIEDFALKNEHPFVRFDYFGHGESTGEFVDGHLGVWLADALTILDKLTAGPQILIGSSMGGWLMLLMAIAKPERIAGLIGVAAAPDFTEDLIRRELTPEQLIEIREKGRVVLPSDYEDDYIFTKALFDEGRKHLIMGDTIPIKCPVRLLHGLNDKVVPWRTAIDISEKLSGNDVELIFIKDGDHRLSSDRDLGCLIDSLSALINRIESVAIGRVQ